MSGRAGDTGLSTIETACCCQNIDLFVCKTVRALSWSQHCKQKDIKHIIVHFARIKSMIIGKATSFI